MVPKQAQESRSSIDIRTKTPTHISTLNVTIQNKRDHNLHIPCLGANKRRAFQINLVTNSIVGTYTHKSHRCPRA